MAASKNFLKPPGAVSDEKESNDCGEMPFWLSHLLCQVSNRGVLLAGLGYQSTISKTWKDQIEHIIDYLLEIYVAPVAKLREIEKKSKYFFLWPWMAEGMKRMMNDFEKHRLKAVKRDSDPKYDTQTIIDAAMWYRKENSKGDHNHPDLMFSAQSERAITGNVAGKDYHFFMSNLVLWVLDDDNDKSVHFLDDEMPEDEDSKLLVIFSLARGYLLDQYYSELMSDITKEAPNPVIITIDDTAQKHIKKEATLFFQSLFMPGATADGPNEIAYTLRDLFSSWYNYIIRAKRIPIGNFFQYFANSSLSTSKLVKIGQKWLEDEIFTIFASIHNKMYSAERKNQQIRYSNRLKSAILARFVFGKTQNATMKRRGAIDDLFTIVTRLATDDDKQYYTCSWCHGKTDKQFRHCDGCGCEYHVV